jgi:hypothetical protein
MSSSSTKQLVQKGSNGEPDIYVDPPALRRVVADFNKHLPALANQAQTYAANTEYVDGEFGRLTFLAETQHVVDQYKDLRKKAIEALWESITLLALVGASLGAASDDYDRADGIIT